MVNAKNISESDFDIWFSQKEIEYASTLVRKPEYLGRICFLVMLSGGYKVTLRDEVIYQGGSFDDASSAYNSIVAGEQSAVS